MGDALPLAIVWDQCAADDNTIIISYNPGTRHGHTQNTDNVSPRVLVLILSDDIIPCLPQLHRPLHSFTITQTQTCRSHSRY